MLPTLRGQPQNHVVVAYARSLEPSMLAARDALLRMLSSDERERYARFRFDDDKQTYLVAHALTRALIGAQLNVEPSTLAFTTTEHGRPELTGAHAVASEQGVLRFNLSHTKGMVACALAHGVDIGVDVEQIERHVDLMGVAARVFSAHEVAGLHALEGEAQRVRFFELWTLKEAYIKAIGKGFAAPLQAITFEVQPNDPVAVRFDVAEIDDRADTWCFRRLLRVGGYRIAAGWKGSDPAAISCSEVGLQQITSR